MLSVIFSYCQSDPSCASLDKANASETEVDKYTIVKKEVEQFKLPITYLDPSHVYSLSPTVSNDLELIVSKDTPSMYEYLFQPKHLFAKCTMPAWQEKYTTDINYLNDTQYIVENMGNYQAKMSSSSYSPNCEKLFDVWNSVKNDDSFLDKYSYMEWDLLKHLNNSSAFLQSISLVNIASPVISLSIPFLFMILPFLLLKFQGVPVTFSAYLDVLKHIAKNHFIGKALSNMGSISWDKIIYLLVTLGLYLLQIYQNVTSCIRFYKNVQRVNESLMEMRLYTKYSIESMENFLDLIDGRSSYFGFSNEVKSNLGILRRLNSELQFINPFSNSVKKLNEIGYMLKCFYKLYSDSEYTSALRFSMGFEGYINNLLGVNENLTKGVVSFAKFETNGSTETGGLELKQQYYPPLINEMPVKNTCKFDKNMIISSPNKSGKTTILKTTAINIIFSQQLGCGFYSSAKMVPYTHIHSYLNIPDTSGRDSLFQAESRRCKEIIDVIREQNSRATRHFCVFDELYSGTNPEEASKAGHAFLSYLSRFENVNFILTTHYFSICKKFKTSDKIQNYKMDVRVSEDGTFKYTYKVKKGISKIKGGIRVLKDMDYPKEILDLVETSG
jgi:hypothetical protein